MNVNNQEITTIRRPFRATPVQKDGPRSNRDIRVPRVQLIDAEGQNHGDVSIQEAIAMAEEAGLDLVEIVPNAEPPVCKIVDLGKLKYQNQKKAAEARKKQKTVEIKEIKMRPKIGVHDYETKKGHVKRFLNARAKVKVTIMFRGREQSHPERGRDLLMRLAEDVKDIGQIESPPLQDGRNMVMVLGPTKMAGQQVETASA